MLKVVQELMTIGSGEMSPVLWIPMYLAPVVWLVTNDDSIQELFYTNLKAQACLFLFVCQIPVLITGKMAYVDIAWPGGLVLLSIVSFTSGTAPIARRAMVCVPLFLHGLRMFLGALMLFGKMTKVKYVFSEDLPRYQYAKQKWIDKKMPSGLWWLKCQHDTMQQGFANSCVLSAPILLSVCFNDLNLHAVEIMGLLTWGTAWYFENVADLSKQRFLRRCRAEKDPKIRKENKTAVLGYGKWSTKSYWMWTKCRHPNYFCEWMGWIGFVMIGIPPLLSMDLNLKFGYAFLYFAVVRFFYDCLVHWTGAGPAEFYSVKKRPLYRAYQKSTRCFFPFEMPFVNHHRVANFPSV
jgi:steroid 5-alpha reductase family enzyme